MNLFTVPFTNNEYLLNLDIKRNIGQGPSAYLPSDTLQSYTFEKRFQVTL